VPVFDRRYRGYAGPRVGGAGVRTVARYALAEAFRSRLALVLLVAAALVPLGFGGFVYVANNLDVLTTVGFKLDSDLPIVGKPLFFWFLVWQSGFAFLLAAFVGPTLVSKDLVHQAIPLYLARPLSRSEYVLGKLAALLVPLSAVTWVPGLLLVGLQASLAESGWLAANLRVPWAIFVGSWVWILLLALLALALSAWIRWRPVATGMLFGIFLIGEATGRAIQAVLDTRWGLLLAFDDMVETIWADLFGGVSFLGRNVIDDPLPVAACWASLALLAVFALFVLDRKVRAVEVSR
jgi:ABC-2 type transport system permease protein